jgi:hypothetical protein
MPIDIRARLGRDGLEVPQLDEEIANYLMSVADETEGLRTFVQEHHPAERRRKNQRRLGDTNLRPILISYHLTCPRSAECTD